MSTEVGDSGSPSLRLDRLTDVSTAFKHTQDLLDGTADKLGSALDQKDWEYVAHSRACKAGSARVLQFTRHP